MSEERSNKTEDNIPRDEETEALDSIQEDEISPKRRTMRRVFNRRNGLLTAGLLSILLVFLAFLVSAAYRFGYVDTYIRSQFVTAFDEMGVEFDADAFHVTVNPLRMTLKTQPSQIRKPGKRLRHSEMRRLT